MKILFVCDAIDPALGGGTAERTFRLARALQEVGAEPEVLATDLGLGKQRRAELSGIACTLVRSMGRRFIFPWVSPWRVAERVRASDIVHITGHWSWLGALSGWLAMRQGRPYVYSPAGSLPVFGRSRWIKLAYNALIGRRLVRNATCCMAVTGQEVEHFRQYGVPAGRVVILPNGIDPQLPSDLRGQRARQRYLLGEATLLLFLGRLSPIKGADLLIDAFASISRQYPDVRLVLAGPDAGQRSALERQIRALRLEDRVILTGNVSGREKLELIAAADCLVVPSRQEAMSLVVLEAGLQGKAALITDQCGFDELEQERGGCVVPATAEGLERGLVRLLAEPRHLHEQGENLRRLVLRRYTWPLLADQCLGLYRNLLESSD